MPNAFRYEQFNDSASARTIGDLMMAPAMARARALRESGQAQARASEMSGQAWSGAANTIGQIATGAVQGYQQQRQDREALRRQQEVAERGKRADQNFLGLLQMYPDGNIPQSELATMFGAPSAARILDGISALDEQRRRTQGDETTRAVRIARGMLELDEPSAAKLWPDVRNVAISTGLGTPEQIPEQFSRQHLNSFLRSATGADPNPEPKVTYASPQVYATADGKKVVLRAGSDGRMYDTRNKPFDGEISGEPEPQAGGNSDYARYVARAAGEIGKTADTLTTAEEDSIRQRFYSLSRAQPRATGGPRPGSPRPIPANAGRPASDIDPKLEEYILDMRSRGYTRQQAIDEVFDTDNWVGILAANPQRTAQRTHAAIARLIPDAGAPPSASDPGIGRPGAPVAQPKVLTQQQFQDAVKRLRAQGITITDADAKREYEARGYVIR